MSDNIIAIRSHKFTYYKTQTSQHNIRKLVNVRYTSNDGSLSQCRCEGAEIIRRNEKQSEIEQKIKSELKKNIQK